MNKGEPVNIRVFKKPLVRFYIKDCFKKNKCSLTMGLGIMFSHAYRSGLNTRRKEEGGLNELLLAW